MRISDWSSDLCSSDLVSGYSFSTRGTNFQIDLIRQRRGQKTDFKFGPTISLRGDRTGKSDDPQVAALGKRKVAVEMGLYAGVSHTGVFTSEIGRAHVLNSSH